MITDDGLVGEPVATLEEYGLRVRVISQLDELGIVYLGDLLKLTKRDLEQVPGFGVGVIENIRTSLNGFLQSLNKE